MSDEGAAYAKLFSPLKGGRWLYHYALGSLANAHNGYRIRVSDEWLIREWPGLTPAIIERARGELLKSKHLTVESGGGGAKAIYRFEFVGAPEMALTAISGETDRNSRSNEPGHLFKELEVKREPRKRATSAPERYPLVERHYTYVHGLEGWRTGLFSIANETSNFLDHHAARGQLFVDWYRAWQKWMRDAVTYALRREGPAAVTQNPQRTKATEHENAIRALELSGDHEAAEELRREQG